MTARARLIPFIPGGPLDVLTIHDLYRIRRDVLRRESRLRSLIAAVRIDIAAWRYSRALQP